MTVLAGRPDHLLATADAVLLDFDGPICDVFAGRPASLVAATLIRALLELGATPPAAIATEPDPLAVLRWTGASCGEPIAVMIDDILINEETLASETAVPTPGADIAIQRINQTGVPLIVVSNNSSQAVRAFLDRVQLSQFFSNVVGRRYGNPALMKPSPEALNAATRPLGVESRKALMIGDSLSDLEAARAAGASAILLANKPHKAAPYLAAGADAVVTQMIDLARP